MEDIIVVVIRVLWVIVESGFDYVWLVVAFVLLVF